MPRNTANWTPERWEEHRQYLTEKKRESRERQKDRGECIVKSPWCDTKAKKGGATCEGCDRYSVEHERAREGGWRKRPHRDIPRTIRKLRREGKTVNDILQDPYLVEYDVKREEVSDILRAAGLLE